MNIPDILLAVKKAELTPESAVAVVKNLCESSGDYTANDLVVELVKLYAEACGEGDGASADYIGLLINALLLDVRQDLLGGR